jgi:hypothetical protein
MSDQARRAQQSTNPSPNAGARFAQRLRRRGLWIAALGFGVVVLSTHWVWAVIAALLTLFLVFAVDDEVKEIEGDI